MEKYTEALIDFDRAISLDGDYIQAFVIGRLTYRIMEKYAEALIDFDRAILHEDMDLDSLLSRGNLYLAEKI